MIYTFLPHLSYRQKKNILPAYSVYYAQEGIKADKIENDDYVIGKTYYNLRVMVDRDVMVYCQYSDH